MRRDRLGLVFQQFNLIPSLKVADNLAFQARIADRFDAAWQNELTERLGLATCATATPSNCPAASSSASPSAARLASRPALLLADEPTGNLDEATADEVVTLMTGLVKHAGCGLLMVTHSTRLAGLLDRRVHLTGGRIT